MEQFVSVQRVDRQKWGVVMERYSEQRELWDKKSPNLRCSEDPKWFRLSKFHLWDRVLEKQLSIIRKPQKQCVYFNIFQCQRNFELVSRLFSLVLLFCIEKRKLKDGFTFPRSDSQVWNKVSTKIQIFCLVIKLSLQ